MMTPPTIGALTPIYIRCFSRSTSITLRGMSSPHRMPHSPSTRTRSRLHGVTLPASRSSCSAVRYTCFFLRLRGSSMPLAGLSGIRRSFFASSNIPASTPWARRTTLALRGLASTISLPRSSLTVLPRLIPVTHCCAVSRVTADTGVLPHSGFTHFSHAPSRFR